MACAARATRAALRRGPPRAAAAVVAAADGPSYERGTIGWLPIFSLIWFAPEPFVYETLYGGAERSPAGRSAVRTSTLAQALALGKRLEAAAPGAVSYSVYKMQEGSMELKGTFPKGVNAEGARIKFRRRRPRTGGADDALLGVGGMGDDVWRELIERGGWGSVDDAWAEFRKSLELGREIEAIDSSTGERIETGDYPDDEEPEYD